MQAVNGVYGERSEFKSGFQTGVEFIGLGFLPAFVVGERTQGLTGKVKLVGDMGIVALADIVYGQRIAVVI
jgi:hypothetical protein